jgi:hypothetical protein
MAKGSKFPAFLKKGGSKVAREAKSEGEPVGVERKEMAQGFKRGGKIKRK